MIFGKGFLKSDQATKYNQLSCLIMIIIYKFEKSWIFLMVKMRLHKIVPCNMDDKIICRNKHILA